MGIGEANRTAVSIDALLDWVGEDVAHLRAVFESYLTEGESVCESGCLMKLLIDCGVELDPADLRRELALLGLATGRSLTFADFLRCYCACVRAAAGGPYRDCTSPRFS